MSVCPYHCQNGMVLVEALHQRVPCPHCSGIAKYVEQDPTDMSAYDILKIPQQYWGCTPSNAYDVIADVASCVNNNTAKDVSDLLRNIEEGVEQRKLYKMSCYINVPNTVDIYKYVYCTQLNALVHGIGVMPFISANTLNFLMHGEVLGDRIQDIEDTGISNDGRTGKTVPLSRRLQDITGFDYIDYINAPLIFIDITCGTNNQGWVAVADLLAERGKLGLATYLIGYWHIANSGNGVFLETKDSKRLDKLQVVEVTNKIQEYSHSYNSAYESDDSNNNNGIKVKGFDAIANFNNY